MPTKLILEILLFSLILILIILFIVRKGRISVKYSLVWFFSILIILICAILPNFMISISKFLGFVTMSNMIFSLLFAILIFICISLTIIVSGQKEKIKLLIQEVSMIKSQINKKEVNKNERKN